MTGDTSHRLERDLHVEGKAEQVVDIFSGDTVKITKDFGPWAVGPLYITLDYDTASWILEVEDDMTGERRVIYQLVVD